MGTRPAPLMREIRPELLTRATVGPEAELGRHVMYDKNRPPPVGVQGWDGWPVNWQTPNWDSWFGGFGTDYTTRVSTLMTSVDLNTRQLASFPIYGTRSKDRARVELPSWSVNPAPGYYQTFGEFMKQLANSYQIAGEAFVWSIARDARGFPARFVVLNPHVMEVRWEDGGPAYYLSGSRLDTADVLHIKYQSVAGNLRGIGPLEWACSSLTTAHVLESYAREIAESGVWAVLKHPNNINTTQAQDMKDNWKTQRKADPSAPAILSGGIEFETLSISPKDMALLDLRVMSDQRIAAAFGVPPFLVGVENPGGMTYNTTNSLFELHWRQTLRPTARTFAEHISAWALPHGRGFEFDRDEYTRPSFQERTQGYSVMANIEDEQGRPAITVEEIRTIERLQPHDADDRERILDYD